MSAEELRSFITNYITDYESSPYKDKTIRIMGHLVKDGGYYYFLGLNSEGKQTWFIEAFEPTGSVDIPLGVTGYLNPVELIGTLSFYSEGRRIIRVLRSVTQTALRAFFHNFLKEF
jgi:hypothetical protein